MPKTIIPLSERFNRLIRKSEDPNGCWEWIGGTTPSGYGLIRLGRKVEGQDLIHRVSYKLYVGEIPDGMTVDHLCHTKLCRGGPSCPHRRCGNPKHLQLLSTGDNTRRGNSGIKNKEKTHCTRGHEYITENTYVTKTGARQCRKCREFRRHVIHHPS